MSLCYLFYSRHTKQEIKRHKCNFFVGFIACILTVIVAAVVSTVVDKAPLFMLKEAEDKHGQFDYELVPTKTPYLNFTQLQKVRARDSPLIKHFKN